ncbi:bacillithiol biosynthesis cysteine-adding enzyme BshC [Priestia endophytica]
MELIDYAGKPLNPLMNDYVNGDSFIGEYFHYDVLSPNVYKERKEDLMLRSLPREALVNHLLSYNEHLGACKETLASIETLRNEETTVVVGGQQAGLLTGPLYTINKIVSILNLAKEQEEKLGSRVLPVFWIAGEDHDIAEINHIFVEENGMKKHVYKDGEQKMASEAVLHKETLQKWVKEAFQAFGEKEYSKEALSFVETCLQSATTYVDFFALLITKLFSKHGLILIDSGSSSLRKIEADFFTQLIKKNAKISEALEETQGKLRHRYKNVIETDIANAHIFYSENGRRVLLQRNGAKFYGKNGRIKLSEDELLTIAEVKPELLSNNVVTRPLMQEYLFPTLAFIAGPGEVAYWAELGDVFDTFDMKMPPVVPRLSYTFIERGIARDMEKLDLSLEDVFSGNVSVRRDEWLKESGQGAYLSHIEYLEEEVEKVHSLFRDKVLQENKNYVDLLHKNRQLIMRQISAISQIMEKDHLKRHSATWNKYLSIENALVPQNAPQERIWNVFYYINKYGFTFVDELVSCSVEFDHKLKIIYL